MEFCTPDTQNASLRYTKVNWGTDTGAWSGGARPLSHGYCYLTPDHPVLRCNSSGRAPVGFPLRPVALRSGQDSAKIPVLSPKKKE